MPLVLHDTLTREKRSFQPREAGRVSLYVCGPTVYNHAHIGNARPFVVFDVLFRLLQRLYPDRQVIYARNLTDVDDKINRKAADEGVPISTITDRYTGIFHRDMDALGVLRPTFEPRATGHIDQMIELIGRLVDKGHAYAAEGHVLFDVGSYPAYGALSRRNLEEMEAGARVEVAPYKKAPFDFVLWKPSKPGEPEWPSPWGAGRPGWHIECSAMIEAVFGGPIDIHAGGIDLVFPHHENEIAQSVCGCGHATLANYWMHNGFLTMDAEKMSKSLGNVTLISELLDRAPGEALRWALLSAHYRQPLDWTDALVEQSKKNLDRLYGALRRVKQAGGAKQAEAPAEVLDALADDLNTPAAIAALFETAGAVERALNEGDGELARTLGGELAAAGRLMGVLQQDPDAWFEGGADEAFKARVDALLEARAAARAAKDWAEADRIRDELTALQVAVMDGPTGATWRRA